MFSMTTQGRSVEYVPVQYTPRAIQDILDRQQQNADRVPYLLRLWEFGDPEFEIPPHVDGLRPEEVEDYIYHFGITRADQARLQRWNQAANLPGTTRLRVGEAYIGRPCIVIFNIGTSRTNRQLMINLLWADIEEALEGTP
jgi:hypothetical protein